MKKVGTDMAKLNITWPQFAICNDNCTKAFEDMCRRLFTAEFLKGEILPHSDSNNPGVEVLPVLEPEREDGQPRKRISFQCKYVDSAANAYSEFQKSAKITAKIYQGNLDLVYLFCNKTLTTSTKAYQTIVNIHAAAGIETKPVSNDELLDMIAKHEDISEYFFQQRKISESNRFNMIIQSVVKPLAQNLLYECANELYNNTSFKSSVERDFFRAIKKVSILSMKTFAILLKTQ